VRKEKSCTRNAGTSSPAERNCEAPALKGTSFCYFHTRLHRLDKTPPGTPEPIDIPALEDRAAIQLTITQILRAFANGSIDQKRTYTLLYGLQLASQNVDRTSWAIPIKTIRSLDCTEEGQELAPKEIKYELDDYEDEGDEADEDDDDEDGDDGEDEDNDDDD